MSESISLAERQLLGALLLDPDAYGTVAGVLTMADFETSTHAHLFQACADLFASGARIEPAAVIQRLGDTLGASDFVMELHRSVGSAADVGHYAKMIREASLKRALQAVGNSISSEASSPLANYREVQDRAYAALAELASGDGGKLTPGATTLAAALQEIDDAVKRGGAVPGLPTGLPNLDRLVLGLNPGDLMVIGAGTSIGKTALALQIADQVAASGKRVLFYSLEMPAKALMTRILARRTRIDAARLRCGKVDDDDHHRLVATAAEYAEEADRLMIDDGGRITPARISADLTRERARGKIDLVVVDHIQLMRSSRRVGNTYERVTEVSGALKSIALKFEVPVIALSQLNRARTRESRRPNLADLRDSGAIEQDADLVVLLDRPPAATPLEEQRGAYVAVEKNRNGRTGIAHDIDFITEYQEFVQRREAE